MTGSGFDKEASVDPIAVVFLVLILSAVFVLVVGLPVLLVVRQRQARAALERWRQSLEDGRLIGRGQIPPRYQRWVVAFRQLQTDDERTASLERFLSGEC